MSCRGDSGSGVFAGSYYGYDGADPHYPAETHKLLAIMSSITQPKDDDLTDGQKCLSATRMSAEIVALQKSWLCGKAPDLAGCRP